MRERERGRETLNVFVQLILAVRIPSRIDEISMGKRKRMTLSTPSGKKRFECYESIQKYFHAMEILLFLDITAKVLY